MIEPLVPPGHVVTAAFVSDNGTWTSGPPLRFRAASVTKTFVAATALLVTEPALLQRAPLAGLLHPELAAMLVDAGYDTGRLTLEHLLGHRAGLPDHSVLQEFQTAVRAEPQRRWSRADQLSMAVRAGPPLCDPGEAVHYSDTGYVLVGDVLERLTQRPLGELVSDVLELPARAPDTSWERGAVEGARFPQRIDDLSVWDIDASVDLFGGGGLVSTAADLAAFGRDLMSGRILPSSSQALMLDQGLGIMRAPSDVELWGHLGFWGTAMLGSRSGIGIGVAVSPAPSAGGADPGRVALRVLDQAASSAS